MAETIVRPPIYVRTGTGTGPTAKAAFDAALEDAGVARFNLVPLSSVIPMLAGPVAASCSPPEIAGAWGDRLYCVIAHAEDGRPGRVVAALGWAQLASGPGIFVEHEAWTDALDEAYARERIEYQALTSLASMRVSRGWAWEEAPSAVLVASCPVPAGAYASAVVVAPFESVPWRNWPCRPE